MPEKVMNMIPHVVRSAAWREKTEKARIISTGSGTAVFQIEGPDVKVMKLFVPNAVVQPKFLLNLKKTGLYTAGSAIFRKNVSTNSFNVFPAGCCAI